MEGAKAFRYTGLAFASGCSPYRRSSRFRLPFRGNSRGLPTELRLASPSCPMAKLMECRAVIARRAVERLERRQVDVIADWPIVSIPRS
jgi:hypothetical protein